MSDLSIIFGGDFAPCRRFESIVIQKKERIFNGLLDIIKESDISVVNLECPLTNSGDRIEKIGPNLKADTRCIKALRPFSLVGLANNHIMDYGVNGLNDTIEACRNEGIKTIGAGLSMESAQQVRIIEKKGIKVAFIAIAENEFNQSLNNGLGSAPIDPIENYKQIELAKKKADAVIVFLHGGNEYFPYPRPGLRKLCHFYIDLGASSVICHHPHVPGAYEYYKNKPIVYSLGNLIFDHEKPPEKWDMGYMVKLSYIFNDGGNIDVSLQLFPYQQSVEENGARLLNEKEKLNFIEHIEILRKDLQKEKIWLSKWDSFIESKTESYIAKFFLPFKFKGLGYLIRHTNISKLLVSRSNGLNKFNMLRCQSHYEALVSILESKINRN